MPIIRPAIPLEVHRSIFVEAGHRCACCGTAFPLERAHIVPWAKSNDHSKDNLLCLCANCHQMADKYWDRKTFFAYKARPWVNRQFSPASTAPSEDVLKRYLNTAHDILNAFSTLQRLLAQQEVDQAEEVMQTVAVNARTLYDLGVALRSRLPKLTTEDLTALDKIYDNIAQILNEKQGDIFLVGNAIAEAEEQVKQSSSEHNSDKMAETIK